MDIVDALREYGYEFTDEQLLERVKNKMLDWKQIAPFRPKSLREVGEAVRELGLSAPDRGSGQ